MTLRPFVLLLSAALVGCLHNPVFEYDVEPGAPVAQFKTIALDPRPLVWQIDGKHAVDPWEYREAIVKELRTKGYHFAKPDEADLWLDIIAMAPGSGQTPSHSPMVGTLSPGRNLRAGGTSQKADGSPMTSAGGTAGAGAPAYNALPTEMTVIVKLVSRAEEKSLWYGSVVMPANRSSGPQLVPADWIRKLMTPLPAQAGAPAGPGAEPGKDR